MSYEPEHTEELYRKRGWSHYRPALEMDTSPNDIGDPFRCTTVPSIPTIRCTCEVMGIAMAQFHSADGVQVTLNEQQRRVMDLYDKLDPLNRSRAEAYMEGLSAKVKDIQRQNGSQKQPRTDVWEFPHAGWTTFFMFYMFFAFQLRLSVFPTCLSH